MKISCRRIAALMLCIIMLLSQAIPCFAAESEEILPHIDIRGFMNADIYEDMNDPESEQLWPLDVKRILKAAGSCVPSLAQFAVNKDYEKLTESIVPYVNELFRPLMCDNYGNPIEEKSGAYLYRPTYDEVMENPKLSFTYDWRIDPFISASRLNDFINYLTDELGFGKVMIECHSNGGVVLLAYFARYGAEKVKSCCFSASAIYGAGFAGELVKGNLVVDSDGLIAYMLSAFDNSQREELLRGLMEILDRAGIIADLSDFVNSIVESSHDYLFQKTILPVFGNWLNIWAMVPDDDVEAGKDYIFNRLLANDGKNHTEFLAKADTFTNEVRAPRERLLKEVNSKANVYVFSFYGYTGIPITTDWAVMSDGVLMSADSSFGARFYSSVSADEFEPGPYVSPDGKVNGETALFPDQTWYFKYCRHSLQNEFLDEMAQTLLCSDEQATVKTYEQYPQFLTYNGLTRTIEPDNGTAIIHPYLIQRAQSLAKTVSENIRSKVNGVVK